MEDLVPAGHLLRSVAAALDFDFIYELVEDKYSTETGRPSIDPVVLVKFLWTPPTSRPARNGTKSSNRR